MAVEVKRVLLNLAEENAKVLLKEVIKPLLVQAAEEKAPAFKDVLVSLIDSLEAEGLKLVDKIDGEEG